MKRCPKCGSGDCVRSGHNHGRQRYKCKGCGRLFTLMRDKNATKRAFALYLYVVGLSMNAIARLLGVRPSTVLYWIRNFTLKISEKPEPQDGVDAEFDDMRHFLEEKGLKYGCERYIVALPLSALTGNEESETEKSP